MRLLLLAPGGHANRTETRNSVAISGHGQPRTTRRSPLTGPVGLTCMPSLYAPYQSAHHSHTLPNMPQSPQPFGCSSPIGWINLPESGSCPPTCATSAQQSPCVPERAAYSHSASVGSRYFPSPFALIFFVNFCASFHDTLPTGRSGHLTIPLCIPITDSHCACVTGYFPNQYPRWIRTRWTGCSSWAASTLPEPISNSPGGMYTSSIPVDGLFQVLPI